jgi:hypothetical protein
LAACWNWNNYFFIIFNFFASWFKKQGVLLSLLTSFMAVATITLYNYDITYYNSVAAEQTLIYLILLVFLVGMAFFKAKENPFAFLKQKIYFFSNFN